MRYYVLEWIFFFSSPVESELSWRWMEDTTIQITQAMPTLTVIQIWLQLIVI